MSETSTTRRSLRDRRPSKTNWDRLNHQTDDEINSQAASDQDAAPILTSEWLSRAKVVQHNKKLITIRLDASVLEFFQKDGKNYQTRINNVLKAYIELNNHSS